MSRHSANLSALLLLCAGLLSGCGSGLVTTASQGTLHLQGKVHGGQQPVSGSSVQIYVAGKTGNGSTAAPLIPTGSYFPGGANGCVPSGAQVCNPGVVSDANGNFTLSGDYTCLNASDQVYVVATGGNPGLASGTNNPALVLVDAIGTCSNLPSMPYIYVDEVTTVAAAWALAPFMASATQTGASPTNAAGLANAFLDAQLLADITNGYAKTLPANLTIESGKLYALANVLASCVNSDGTAACLPLFAAATPAAGAAPTNTLTAALNIVKNPGRNVATVFAAMSATPPFATTLTQSPNDWTMSLTVTGGGLFMPTALAIDSSNNVWVAGQTSPLSAFGPQGTPLSSTGFGQGVFEQAYGLAIASNDIIWVTNYNSTYNGAGAMTLFNGSTSSSPGSVHTNQYEGPVLYDSAISYPNSVTADTNGNVYIANDGTSSVTVYSSAPSDVAASLGANYGFNGHPQSVAVDTAHGFWMPDGAYHVAHLDISGNLLSYVNCCYDSNGVAVDANGNLWVTNYLSNSISEIASNGTLLINQSGIGGVPQSGIGGMNHPDLIAIDAAQNLWITNFRGASITELAGSNASVPGAAISPTAGVYGTGGYGLDAGLSNPFSAAPDTAGNLWVSNAGLNQITMFFGLATPTVTPSSPTPKAP